MRIMLASLGLTLARFSIQHHSHMIDHGVGVHLVHDLFAAELDGLVTQSQFSGDRFVLLPGNGQIQHLPLPSR